MCAELAGAADAEIVQLGERGFFLRDGFLGAGGALSVREAVHGLQAAGRFHAAGVGRGGDHRGDPEVRSDEITWVPADEPAFGPLWEGYEALRRSLNEGAYLGLERFDVQAALYPGGGARYVKHRDAFQGLGSRRLTAILYLNEGWVPEHGGVLRLYADAGPVDVEPVMNRLVVFLSERVEHEVLPVFAPRLAVTAWYYGRQG